LSRHRFQVLDELLKLLDPLLQLLDPLISGIGNCRCRHLDLQNSGQVGYYHL